MALAEAITDVGAGWAGAGLLGLVLAWLLFVHLPAKDKQLKEMFEMLRQVNAENQQRMDEKSDDYTQREDKRDDKFLAALREVAGEVKEMGKAVGIMCKWRVQHERRED